MATDTEVQAPATTEAPAGAAPRRVVRAAWVLPLILLLLAAGLRFYRLGEPDRMYFDEVYYAEDGASLLERGVEEGFVVHPQVGKWVIAVSIGLLGDDPLGWRAGMAAAGSLTVLMTYLAGLRLFRRRGVAALAGFLVAIDGLAFTMSRISMLDAALGLFVVTGFWLLLRDRDATWAGVELARLSAAGEGDEEAGEPRERAAVLPRRPHRDRWLAGIFFGLAIATKWSGLLALGGAGLLVLISELSLRRRVTGRWLTAWPRLLASGLLTLVVVPAVVYVASYASWFVNFEDTRPGERRCGEDATECAVPLPELFTEWLGEQRAIAVFHRDLDATHRYRAPATTWLVLARPVAYYYESCTEQAQRDKEAEGEECVLPPGMVAEILGIGNPAIWWMALLAYPLLAWDAFRRRTWAAIAIGVMLAAQYVPWLVASRPLFLFYMTPVVPFIALALAYGADRVRAHPLLRWVPAAVAGLATVAFLFWYPVWSGMELPEDSWRLRMWTERWI